MNKYVLIKYLSICVVTCYGLAGCRDEARVPGKQNTGNKMNFACVRYDSAALEYRLDSMQIRGFTMQFFISEAGDNNSPYQLISYAFDTLGDYRNSWIPDTLGIVTDSVPKTFEGRVTMGNNEVTREQLYDVLNDENGKRISYDYVLFTPTVEGIFNHMVYHIRPIKGNATAVGNKGKMQMSSPLPPSRVW